MPPILIVAAKFFKAATYGHVYSIVAGGVNP